MTQITARKIARYGWKPDLPRKGRPVFKLAAPKALKTSYDLRAGFDPVYDQGDTGSCVGNSTAAAFRYVRRAAGMQDWMASRLFIYYAARALAGTQREDAGAQIHDAFAQLVARGAPPEQDWPFNPVRLTSWPPQRVWDEAAQHKAMAHERVPQSIKGFKTAFDADVPIVFGFTVYDSFEGDEVAKTGVMTMPTKAEAAKDPVGGHAVCAVGCDDARMALLCRNSWGPTWGQGGYFWMPYEYALDPDLASDFQLVRRVMA